MHAPKQTHLAGFPVSQASQASQGDADADVMMARPALRLDLELPRFELELSDDDCTLELVRPEFRELPDAR